MSISDERLAAIYAETEAPATLSEIDQMVLELQSLRAAAKVRAIREGDGEAEAWQCNCASCISVRNSRALAASPIPATGGETE